MPDCKNCGFQVSQNYCPNCGQPATLKRINGHYITHEIEHILHFERGILYTVKALLVKPGDSVRHFITENRSRLVKPIIFIIITSLLYSLVNHFFHIEDGYVEHGEAKQSTTGLLLKWIQDHYGYANIMMGSFIALWTRVFFRKYNYNFFEILILLCFSMGMGMLIFTVFAIIQGVAHVNLLEVGGYVGIIYCTWAIAQFFDKRKWINYLKAFGAYMLGMITFFALVMMIGTLVDLIWKR